MSAERRLLTRRDLAFAAFSAGFLFVSSALIIAFSEERGARAAPLPVAEKQTAPPAATRPTRWRMAVYPSLNVWSKSVTAEHSAGTAALRAVEAQIAARNGGRFDTAMTANPALVSLVRQVMAGRDMKTALFERDDDSLVLSVVRISPFDATVLLDTCSDEVRTTIAGLPFVRMSDPDAEGFVAMLPRTDGALILLRSTRPESEVTKLVTGARLAELGYPIGT